MNVDIETGCRYQKALLWESTGNFDNYGNRFISAHEEISVRWENVRKELRSPSGQTIAIVAKVVVDRVIPMGSILWLGGETDLPGTASVPESDLCQVVDFKETPDIYGEYYRRVAMVARFTDTLPTIE